MERQPGCKHQTRFGEDTPPEREGCLERTDLYRPKKRGIVHARDLGFLPIPHFTAVTVFAFRFGAEQAQRCSQL